MLYIWNNGTFIYIDKKTPLKSMTCIKKVCSVGTEQSGTNGTENLLLHLHQHRAPSSSSGNYHEKIATKKRTKKKPAEAGWLDHRLTYLLMIFKVASKAVIVAPMSKVAPSAFWQALTSAAISSFKRVLRSRGVLSVCSAGNAYFTTRLNIV